MARLGHAQSGASNYGQPSAGDVTKQTCSDPIDSQPRSRAMAPGAQSVATPMLIAMLAVLAAAPTLTAAHTTGRALLRRRPRFPRGGFGGREGVDDDYGEYDDEQEINGGGIAGIVVALLVVVLILVAVGLCFKFGVLARMRKKNKTEMQQFTGTNAGTVAPGTHTGGAGHDTAYGTPVGGAAGKPMAGGDEQSHLPDAAAFGGGTAAPANDHGGAYPQAAPPADGAGTYPYGTSPAGGDAPTYPYGNATGGAPAAYPYGAMGGAATYPAPGPPYGQ